MTNEHYIGVLISLLGVLAMIAGVLFWRMITRLEKKNDEVLNWIINFPAFCRNCKAVEKDDFVLDKAFKLWKEGRTGKGGILENLETAWRVINNHSHEGIPGEGYVIRKT